MLYTNSQLLIENSIDDFHTNVTTLHGGIDDVEFAGCYSSLREAHRKRFKSRNCFQRNITAKLPFQRKPESAGNSGREERSTDRKNNHLRASAEHGFANKMKALQ